jgi:uncharacterized protein YprB with RNaseH-like and TPR domain
MKRIFCKNVYNFSKKFYVKGKYVIVDVETTGLGKNSRIIEISCKKLHGKTKFKKRQSHH